MANIVSQVLIGVIATGWLTSCQPAVSPPVSDVPMRAIEHAMGTTQVPVAPQRVVVLDYAPLDTALALDITPIGRTEMTISPIYPEVVDNITVVGEGLQPNLETVLQLKPDLILGSKVGISNYYRRLSRIAPTVFTTDNGRYGNWQEHFLLHADALGRTEKAEELIADYQQRVDALKSQLAQVPQTTTVSVVSHWSGGVIAYTTNSFSGSVLQDLGFERNPLQGKSKGYALQPSKEELDAIDGDVVFLMHDSEFEGSIAKEDFVSDPLWSKLDAVKQGTVCEVRSTVWAAGRSILGANQILADIEQCLTQSS
ncbi:MAG: iron-siderophore ABC transporter substrate-binding protein [Cyanobacteria bacterium P01_H01_bin.105]